MLYSVSTWWQHIWEDADYWNAFWPAVWGALIGAAAATGLERLYRTRERISIEVGECNKLIFILGQMLSTLQDFEEGLFGSQRKKLGRAPEWNEIGALAGAPTQGPEFIIGEYTFLLENKDPKSAAPSVLGRIYVTEARFKAIIAILNQRSQLWHQYNEYRADGPPSGTSYIALTARLKELTAWLMEDIPEAIKLLKAAVPELRETLEVRYPKRHFIRLWPTDDSKTSPL